MNEVLKKEGVCIENILLIEKLSITEDNKKLRLITAHDFISYILDIIFDSKEQLREFDLMTPAETKLKLYYTKNHRPKGYFAFNFFVSENGKTVELNYSRLENKVQYYGYIEKM